MLGDSECGPTGCHRDARNILRISFRGMVLHVQVGSYCYDDKDGLGMEGGRRLVDVLNMSEHLVDGVSRSPYLLPMSVLSI